MTVAWMIARKEAGTLLYTPEGLSWLLTLAAAMSGFLLLLTDNIELSLLNNAQVIYDIAALLIASGALLAIVVGSGSVAGERGNLLPLLLAPVPLYAVRLGKLGGIVIAWTAMFAISLPYLLALDNGWQDLPNTVLGVAVSGSAVVLGFGFLAMGITARLDSLVASLFTSFVVLLAAASAVLLGPSLRQSEAGRLFDAVNPFSAALNVLDALVMDGQIFLAHVWPLMLLALWFLLTLRFAARGFRVLAS